MDVLVIVLDLNIVPKLNFYCSYKGLDKAIRELLPFVEHRFCTRHLEANLTKVFTSQAVRNASEMQVSQHIHKLSTVQ